MKFWIVTSKTKDVEKALTVLQEKLMEHANKGLSAFWKMKSKGKYGVSITYFAQNRMTNFIIKREFINSIKKIDKNAKLEEVKENKEKEFDKFMG